MRCFTIVRYCKWCYMLAKQFFHHIQPVREVFLRDHQRRADDDQISAHGKRDAALASFADQFLQLRQRLRPRRLRQFDNREQALPAHIADDGQPLLASRAGAVISHAPNSRER